MLQAVDYRHWVICGNSPAGIPEGYKGINIYITFNTYFSKFTLFLLNTQGISLNMVSLMGLALAVGSLVDNSVVTLDNIFDHMQEY